MFLTTKTLFYAVSRVFPVTPEDITGNRRRRNEADARKCAAWIMHHHMRMSNSQIDHAFGRARGAGLHGRKAAEALIATDKSFSAMVHQVGKLLGIEIGGAS
jgi:chromosomal replication initiation ATPase DnaA